jgi:CLIP-associating protein 1/2
MTSQYILTQLGLIDTTQTELSASLRNDDPPAPNHTEKPALAPKPESRQRVASATGTFSVAGSVATTSAILSAPGAEMEQLDAVMIASRGDLEYEIQGMSSAFEGRESEGNWNARDKCIMRLRGLLRGNGYSEYPAAFMAGIGTLQSGIVKGV